LICYSACKIDGGADTINLRVAHRNLQVRHPKLLKDPQSIAADFSLRAWREIFGIE